MKKTVAALAVVFIVFAANPSEAKSPWVEARLDEGESTAVDRKATLWKEASQLLRKRAAFPWELERVRRSIARAPQFYERKQDGSSVWVTQLRRQSGCLIGEPIVVDPACE